MGTIVYLDGGDRYMGEQENKSLITWKSYGKDKGAKYLYKGYRYNQRDGEKDSVCVFDETSWSRSEIARRKENGFLGIKKYRL